MEERPLLLLLPAKLEEFEHRSLVEQIMATGLAVAADPPRVAYRKAAARIPDAVSISVAHKQAKRLRKKLKFDPQVVVIFDPATYPLARGLLALMRDSELWYELSAHIPPDEPRLSELHGMAAERARVRFTAADPEPLEEALQRLVAA